VHVHVDHDDHLADVGLDAAAVGGPPRRRSDRTDRRHAGCAHAVETASSTRTPTRSTALSTGTGGKFSEHVDKGQDAANDAVDKLTDESP
jgi:hypothetical protein